MHFISSWVFLLLMVFNLSTGQINKDWSITLNPPEVTAVPGLCALISCTFTYPNKTEPIQNMQWFSCNENNQCDKNVFNSNQKGEELHIEMLEMDPHKQNCSIILNHVNATDQGQYAFRVEGSNNMKFTFSDRLIVAIQEKPIIDIPPLKDGEQANLTCSAPFSCPQTPPDITFWIETKSEDFKDLQDNITLTNNKSHYLSTLTLTPTSKLHNATVVCQVSYGPKNISTSRTLEVTNPTDESEMIWPVSPKGLVIQSTVSEHWTKKELNLLNDTKGTTDGNTTHVFIQDMIKKLDLLTILTFLTGMACSAFIISVALCCWVSCRRVKKHKVLTANPDTGINLETVQTDVDQTGTNEHTPLHGQLDPGTPDKAAPTGLAVEEEAAGAEVGEVTYASIDYSLLEKKPAEEEERESMDTEYAEIKRDRQGNGKRCEDVQDEMSNGETADQIQKGEEEIYSN
ncbi:uncharacterized protein LOC127630159 [Xyrauchen texanus]|uniref:uncharacterized protein LOC127630159 n=1 Tax=Xyrauchen texanus TaxID=154827 RepID=UPI002242C0CB|nr:uncharacterized protein LOC127630159 [Xyrauchen texanus]